MLSATKPSSRWAQPGEHHHLTFDHVKTPSSLTTCSQQWILSPLHPVSSFNQRQTSESQAHSSRFPFSPADEQDNLTVSFRFLFSYFRELKPNAGLRHEPIKPPRQRNAWHIIGRACIWSLSFLGISCAIYKEES
jgi:hypothetical protein